MPEVAWARDDERWTVFGIPTFITRQVEPGTAIAFTMIYEPTEARDDRYRISAVKVIGIDGLSHEPKEGT